MHKHLLILVSLMMIGLVARTAAADSVTPWVEGTKVGDVVTAHAWVITMNAEQTAYGVVVMSDLHQPVLITAEADKGVVDSAALGRWAMVKAKVTKRIDAKTVTVQILEVAPDPPAAQPKAKANVLDRAAEEGATTLSATIIGAGVTCRVEVAKELDPAGQPVLLASVRNDGKLASLGTFDMPQATELEVDGQWYRWKTGVGGTQKPLGPGKEYKDIRITLTGEWVRKGPHELYAYGMNSGFPVPADLPPLVMAAGKHLIRVACYAVPTHANTGREIQAVSEPVTVTLNKAIGTAPGEATGAASPPATAPATNQAPRTDAETADLQRAVGIAVSALHEQPQLAAEGYTLTSAQQIVTKGRYIWLITFKPTRLLPKDPSNAKTGAGGEVFVNIDSITQKPEIRYGE